MPEGSSSLLPVMRPGPRTFKMRLSFDGDLWGIVIYAEASACFTGFLNSFANYIVIFFCSASGALLMK
jgi:hypothetical protein